MGIEVFGSDDFFIDVEVILLVMEFFWKIGLINIKLVINSFGDKESCLKYWEVLVVYFELYIDEFCVEC